MDIKQSVEVCLQKYAVFEGRAARPELWWFILAANVATILALMLDGIFGNSGAILFFTCMALILPALSAQIRRLHDIGRSGWWIFVSAIPVVGFIILLVWLCQPGNAGTNRFGPDPKEADANPTGASATEPFFSKMLPPRPSDLERLEKLHSLFEKGVLTKEEFDAQKATILR